VGFARRTTGTEHPDLRGAPIIREADGADQSGGSVRDHRGRRT
jgi:hypothetical protein